MKGYSDAKSVTDSNSVKSTTRYVFIFGGAACHENFASK